MAGYRRFVAYVYEYPDGKKGNGKGFIKVEARDGRCRMNYRITGIYGREEAPCKIYGYVRTEQGCEGIYLGECDLAGDTVQFQTEMPEQGLGGTDYGLNDLSGLILLTDDGTLYGTGWDDKPVRLEEIRLPKMQEETPGKTEKETTRAVYEELPDETEADMVVGAPADMPVGAPVDIAVDEPVDMAEDEPADIAADMSADEPADVPEDEPADVSVGEPADVPVDVSADVPVDVPADRAAGDAGQDIWMPQMQKEEAETEPENIPDAEGEGWPETYLDTGNEVKSGTFPNAEDEVRSRTFSDPPEANPAASPVWSERTMEKPENDENMDTAIPQTDMPPYTEQELYRETINHEIFGEDPVSNEEMRMEASDEEEAAEQSTWNPEGDREEDEVNLLEELDQDEDAIRNMREMEREVSRKQVQKPAEGELRQQSAQAAAQSVVFAPFSDGEIVECRQITPGELRILARRDRGLMNNNFLRHGYYRYHHLLLGRKRDDGRYILGVPGVYDRQECLMAGMFGFPNFKPARTQGKVSAPRFGYWYRLIDTPDINRRDGF